jgi:hypothetical protein
MSFIDSLTQNTLHTVVMRAILLCSMVIIINLFPSKTQRSYNTTGDMFRFNKNHHQANYNHSTHFILMYAYIMGSHIVNSNVKIRLK